jgi:Fe-S cluster assembly iron-binding protein IscA
VFEISDTAKQQIADYFQGKDIEPIRVFLHQGGCAGSSLALALDELKESDDHFEIDDFTFVIDKALMEEAKPVRIDFMGMGFKVESSLKLGGGGCSGCSSGGSCSY